MGIHNTSFICMCTTLSATLYSIIVCVQLLFYMHTILNEYSIIYSKIKIIFITYVKVNGPILEKN